VFGKQKRKNELDPPPISANSDAVELLRVWAAPGNPQELSLQTATADPGAWGLLLVDIARHAAEAYSHQGADVEETLARIKELFDAEWESPTDNPKELES